MNTKPNTVLICLYFLISLIFLSPHVGAAIGISLALVFFLVGCCLLAAELRDDRNRTRDKL